MNMEQKNDQILARLYKKGIKETPSPDLDRKILNHAAKKNTSVHSSSHFSGDWKVPLSLAASVILVFAIMVQLDQSPEQLEVPPIPTTDKSDIESVPMDEIRIGDFSEPIGEITESDHDLAEEAEELPDRSESQTPSIEKQGKLESRKKRELKEMQAKPESTLEKSRQFDDSQLNNDFELKQAPAETPPVSLPSTKSKTSNAPAPETTKPNKTLKRLPEPSKDASSDEYTNGDAVGGMVPERSMRIESNQSQQTRQREDAPMAQENSDFAPLPAEDWLLMIEQLVARKDYAEAARQLEKFKQAHPQVNVEKLESNIP